MPEKHKNTLASKANKHDLYENSVQNVEFEVEFLAKEFKCIEIVSAAALEKIFVEPRKPRLSGLSKTPANTAIGVDLDAEVLEFGRQRHLAKLSDEQRARLTLHEENVLDVKTEKVDMLAASNFSYWIFKSRALMLQYFKSALASLNDDGAMFLDFFGGYEAHQELKEETEYDDFTYVWHQKKFNPYSNDIECRIHFKFPDGSKMKNAFKYSWRLWSLPEIRELLEEAGFSKIVTYAEGWDEEEEEGNGVWDATENFDADPGWLAYVVALK